MTPCAAIDFVAGRESNTPAPTSSIVPSGGAPRGLPITYQQQLNADLLAFIKS
jgi:hypothetical protein